MKSQLLQDINEVGSSAAAPPAAKRAEPPTQATTAGPGHARAEPSPLASERPDWPGGQDKQEPSPFASERPDWQGAQAELEPHWFDRWGRRVAGWSVGIALTALVAAGGYWVYRESSIENTLVQVAKNSAPALHAPSAVAPSTASVPVPAPATSAAPAPAAAPAAPPAAVAEPAGATPALATAEPAAAKPSQLPVKPASIRPRQKAFVPPVEAEAAEAAHTGQLADTLKECRALGYHASQCLKRGCTMTRYGLACKG
jgi:hypothetical protein